MTLQRRLQDGVALLNLVEASLQLDQAGLLVDLRVAVHRAVVHVGELFFILHLLLLLLLFCSRGTRGA